MGGILAIGGHGSVLWVPEVPEGHGRSQTTLMDLILCSKAPDSGILAVLLDTLLKLSQSIVLMSTSNQNMSFQLHLYRKLENGFDFGLEKNQ